MCFGKVGEVPDLHAVDARRPFVGFDLFILPVGRSAEWLRIFQDAAIAAGAVQAFSIFWELRTSLSVTSHELPFSAKSRYPCLPKPVGSSAMDGRSGWFIILGSALHRVVRSMGLIRCAHPSRGSPPGTLCPLRSHS